MEWDCRELSLVLRLRDERPPTVHAAHQTLSAQLSHRAPDGAIRQIVVIRQGALAQDASTRTQLPRRDSGSYVVVHTTPCQVRLSTPRRFKITHESTVKVL